MAAFRCTQNEVYVTKIRELSQQLQSLCYSNGKERNLQRSAKVIHKLGLAYHQIAKDTTDGQEQKISLIRSAVLLNAAVVRKPVNVAEVRKDLDELCSRVLQLAGSRTTVEDLWQFVSRCVRKIKEHRYWVKHTALEALRRSQSNERRIQLTEQLQNIVFEVYKLLAYQIMEFCLEGKAPIPCKYALIGIGSLAIQDITPYSDFGHFYVLEEGIQSRPDYKEIWEYFHWTAVLFQVVVVNFGETVIPSVTLPFVNDKLNGEDWFFDEHTPHGFACYGITPHTCKFKVGGMTKHWEKEIIAPVYELRTYLNKSEDLTKNHHLGYNIGFVCGDPILYEQIKRNTEVPPENFSIFERVKLHCQVIQYLKNFDIQKNLFKLTLKETANVKLDIFQSTAVFISALGRLNNCRSSSLFDILRGLRGSYISVQQLDDFRLTLAVSYEVRLRIDLKHSSQFDYTDARSEEIPFSKLLLSVLGETHVVEFLFCLSKLKALISNLNVGSTTNRLSVVLNLCSLHMYKKALAVANFMRTTSDENKDDTSSLIYLKFLQALCFIRLEMSTKALRYLNDIQSQKHESLSPSLRYCLSYGYMKLNRNSEAIKCLQKSLKFNDEADEMHHSILTLLFNCYIKDHRLKDAEKMLPLVLSFEMSNELLKALGYYFLYTGNYEESIKFWERILTFCRKNAFNETSDHESAKVLLHIAHCYTQLKSFSEAQKQVATIEGILKSKSYVSKNADRCLAAECKELEAEIEFNKGDLLQAAQFYSETAKLFPPETKFSKYRKDQKANISQCEGMVLYMFDNYELALSCFRVAEYASERERKYRNVMKRYLVQCNIGFSLIYVGRCLEAFLVLQSNIKSLEAQYESDERNEFIGQSAKQLMICCHRLLKPDKVIDIFNKYKAFVEKETVDTNVSFYVGASSIALGQYKKCLEYLERKMESPNRTETSATGFNFTLAYRFKHLGTCCLELKQNERAVRSFERAIEFFRMDDDPGAKEDIASCLFSIGMAKFGST